MRRRVEKRWGYELIWAEGAGYVGKILHVRKGEILSLQYHQRKDETLYLLRGDIRLEVGRDRSDLREVRLEPGDRIRIRPGTVHRLAAEEDSDVLEASTAELDDIVRLEDRYGRIPRGSDAKPSSRS